MAAYKFFASEEDTSRKLCSLTLIESQEFYAKIMTKFTKFLDTFVVYCTKIIFFCQDNYLRMQDRNNNMDKTCSIRYKI